MGVSVSPSTTYKWLGLCIVLALSCLIVLGAWFLPLDRNIVFASERRYGIETVLLIPGKTITQTFIAGEHAYAGFRLYTTTPILQDEKIAIRITDKTGKTLAESTAMETSYYGADDTLRLTFSFRPFYVQTGQHLQATIRLTDGVSLPLKISPRNVYKQGEVAINGQKQVGDISFALVEAVPLAFGKQQGVLAGVIFFIGVTLLYFFIPPRWQWWWAGLLLVMVTPLAILGFWYSDGTLGIADWDYYFSLHESYRRSILTFHSFPIWNPYICGGTAGLADPEFSVFSLTFLVELIFGVATGLRLAIFSSVAIGAVGMLVLGKRLKLSVWGALVAALGVSFGSVTLLELVEGHVNVFAVMWLPWIFWSWIGAYRHDQPGRYIRGFIPTPHTLLCSVFLALTFFQGGIYLLMYTSLAMLGVSLLSGSVGKALRVTFVAGVVALGLSAIKLIPVLWWLKQFPDSSYASSTVTVSHWVDILFGRYLHGTYLLFEQGSGWHEYGAYIGWSIGVLAVIGMVWMRKSRTVQLLSLGALAALLLSATGPALKPMFDVIPYIPRSNISRIILFTVIPLSLLAGFGLDTVRRWVRPRAGVFVIGILGIIAIDLMSLAYPLSEQAFVLADMVHPIQPAPYPLAFTRKRYDAQGEETRTTRSYAAARAGYGTLTYCSVLGPSPDVIAIEDEGDSRFVSAKPESTVLRLTAWSPQTVDVDVKASEETQVTLNTNYSDGWYANGKQAEIVSNRVSATVPPGHHTITFVYHAPGLWTGAFVTAVTVIASASILDHARRRRRGMADA